MGTDLVPDRGGGDFDSLPKRDFCIWILSPYGDYQAEPEKDDSDTQYAVTVP